MISCRIPDDWRKGIHYIMKKTSLTVALLFIISISWSQSLTVPAGTAVSQAPGNRAWTNTTNATGNADGNSSTVFPQLTNGNPNTQVLALTNYNFAALPANITILGIEATVTRNSSVANGVLDVNVQLIKGGTIQTAADRANTTTWPLALTAVTYGGAADLWNNTWTRADIVAANFGIAISATRNGVNTIAGIDAVTITVYYNLVTPILLTSFDVQKTNNGQASIQFITASEDNVNSFIIQRSPDGRQFSDRFTLFPKGTLNTQQLYQVTDQSPLPGTSYYRLKEIDNDGKVYYFTIRQFNNSITTQVFNATFYNGRLVLNINSLPGHYTLSIYDQGGTLINTRGFQVTNQGLRLSFAPEIHHPGIYFVNLKGDRGINETTRVFMH